MLPSSLAVVILVRCCHPHGDAAIVLAVVILARCRARNVMRETRHLARNVLRVTRHRARNETSCAKRDIVRETRHRARNEIPCAKSHIVRETRHLARNEVSCAKKHTSKPFIIQKFCLFLRPVLDTSPMRLRRSFAMTFLQRP